MARSQKRTPRSIVLRQNVAVEVTEAPFHTFDSVRQLDVARLSRAAKARFEVGYFETECCRQAVHAIVKKGMVTELELEPCKSPVRMTPELEKLLKAGAKKLASGRRGSSPLPVPVSEFLADPVGLTIQIKGCIKICIFGYCVWCCFTSSPRWWSRCGVNTPRPNPVQ